MEILAHREKEFPKDLEGRLNAILNVVNTEFKLLTILHLDDAPRDGFEIRARIRETVGTDFYLPQEPNFRSYCHYTLYPIGTVAEEDIIYEDRRVVPCYRLTEAGRKYGRPIAAFTLDYLVENNTSMFNILGSTQSKGKTRSPFNRIDILERLRDSNSDLRNIDIRRGTRGLSAGGILSHLEALKKCGFVDYESCGELRKGRFPYIWVEGKDIFKIEPVRGYSKLTYTVARKLRELKKADYNQVAKALNENSIPISVILAGLKRQGFVIRERWDTEFQSCISLLDKGRRFLNEYIDWIKDALTDGTSLEEMNYLLERLFSNPDKLRECSRTAISLYRDVSPRIDQKPLEETQEKIIQFLTKNPGRRPVEIAKALSLSSVVGWYLTPLFKSGKLRKVRDGKAVRYYLKDQNGSNIAT